MQSHPDEGLVGWKKLHERWWKKTEMGATLIAEPIRNIGRSKKIEEVFSKIVALGKLYREYDDTCKKGE
eukprot:1594755-Karenia_brevis.AAC.1